MPGTRLALECPTGPSLYRRHRPRTFADVIGQEHVVRTLRNAVEQGKVHHAYLFVGSRGTGKTSMAKILAACMNCVNGPTVEPCGQCESCLSIASATSLDVIEMDAASNNSVDDIRDLREKVAYAPVPAGTRSTSSTRRTCSLPQAWNAFLKTLEEPPPRTIFVLATTEAQKVLPTVVDRCHRFDFARPSVEEVAAVLERVVGEEKIEIDGAALALIARHATGSFRDALGTLEQLVTYAGGRQIRGDRRAGGARGHATPSSCSRRLTRSCAVARPTPCALRPASTDSGRDAGQVLRDLEEHARELLAVQVLGDVPAELRVTPERDARLAAQASALQRTDAVRLIDLVSGALEATANGAQARIQLELVLVKAAAPDLDPSVQALMARIERLEAGAGAAPEPTRVAGGSGAAPPPAAKAVEPPTSIADAWPAVVEHVRQENALLAALLQEARPLEVANGTLVLAFAPGAAFLKRKAEQDEHQRAVVQALQTVTGQRLTPRYELSDAGGDAASVEMLTDEELLKRLMEEFDAEEILEEEVT